MADYDVFGMSMYDLCVGCRYLGNWVITVSFSVLYALHAQYIFRTDPLSSGAAFHATQVPTDE